MIHISFDVYTTNKNSQGKDSPMRVGKAFVNKDGSINVILNVIPIDRLLHIRNPQPKT